MDYIIGVARNTRLERMVQPWEKLLEDAYKKQDTKRSIHEFSYAASAWKRERRMLTRLQFDAKGVNPHFVVTSLRGAPDRLYDQLYCQRGEAENRIKEVQLDLFGTRARASSQTIRCRLLKIGACIIYNTRKVYILLASNHPLQHVYRHAVKALPT